jgi:hypothetical protein
MLTYKWTGNPLDPGGRESHCYWSKCLPACEGFCHAVLTSWYVRREGRVELASLILSPIRFDGASGDCEYASLHNFRLPPNGYRLLGCRPLLSTLLQSGLLFFCRAAARCGLRACVTPSLF